MSLFDKDIIQVLPDPQTYFERLCEEEFGFNFTDHSVYECASERFHEKLLKIWHDMIKAYPDRHFLGLSDWRNIRWEI